MDAFPAVFFAGAFFLTPGFLAAGFLVAGFRVDFFPLVAGFFLVPLPEDELVVDRVAKLNSLVGMDMDDVEIVQLPLTGMVRHDNRIIPSGWALKPILRVGCEL